MKRPKTFSKVAADFVEKTVGKDQAQEVLLRAQQKKSIIREGRKFNEPGPDKSGPH